MNKYKETFSKIAPDAGIKERILNNIEGKQETKPTVVGVFRFHKKLAFACAVLLAICLTLPVPQVRAALRHVGELFYESIGQTFGEGSLPEMNQYSSPVLMTAEDQGIKISLNEAVIDEDNLVVTYTIQYENEEVNQWGIGPVCATQIDGKPCGENGGVMPANKIAKNQYQGYLLEDVRDCYKGGKAECEVQFESLQVNNKTILGDWKFKFTVEDKKLVANTLSAKLNKTLKLNDGNPFVLKEMKNNATGATIHATVKPKEELSAYFIAGTDQNGKEIYFAPIESNLAEEDWTFTMMDIEKLTRTTLDDDVREVNVAVYYLAPEVTGKDLEKAKEGNRVSEFVNIKLK